MYGAIWFVVGLIVGGLAMGWWTMPKTDGVRSAMFIYDVIEKQWRPLTTDDLAHAGLR